MSTYDPPAKNEFDGPTLDERLSMPDEPTDYTGDRSGAKEAEQLKEAWTDLKAEIQKNQKQLIRYSLYVGAGSIAVMLIRGQKQKREAAKLAKTFFDLRVTKDQVALLQSADLNVLYDTPFGQLLLAAVPPVEG